MKLTPACPNCGLPVGHEEDGCVLASLMRVVRDRGEHTDEEILRLWANCHADLLWDDIGPIVTRLGLGRYDITEEGEP